VLGLARYGAASSQRLALAELEAMLASHDPLMRAQAARLIGALGLEAYEERLFSLLKDEHLEVERSAISAAGALRSPALLPRLLGKLTNSVTAAAAAEAVAGYGEKALATLSTCLADREQGENTRAWVPAILQRIGGPAAAEVLLDHLGEPDHGVRLAVYKALVRLQGHLDLALPGNPLRQALVAETAAIYALHVLRHDLKEATPLLDGALETRLEAGLERVFLLLELRHPGELGKAYRALQDEDAGGRALAVELLDTLLDMEIKVMLLPLFEATAQAILEVAHARFGLAAQPYERRLEELARGADPWLRACAVFEIGASGRSRLSDLVLATLDSQDSLLRETALHACRSLVEPRHFQEVLRSRAATDPSPVIRAYGRAMLKST
jgi:HEAT repeat protein